MHPLLRSVTKSELNLLYKNMQKGDRKAHIRLDHLLNLFISLRDEAVYYERERILYENSLPGV